VRLSRALIQHVTEAHRRGNQIISTNRINGGVVQTEVVKFLRRSQRTTSGANVTHRITLEFLESMQKIQGLFQGVRGMERHEYRLGHLVEQKVESQKIELKH
jgi:hypothetical protein